MAARVVPQSGVSCLALQVDGERKAVRMLEFSSRSYHDFRIKTGCVEKNAIFSKAGIGLALLTDNEASRLSPMGGQTEHAGSAPSLEVSAAKSIAEPVNLDPIAFTANNALPASPPARKHSFFREYCIPLLFLAISLITTTAIGARYMQNFLDGKPALVTENDLWPWGWLMDDPVRFNLGWAFSLTLLGILLTHEFGHYFACRIHRIRCTLPLVLPAPTLSGTAGAVIQIRGRIPSRSALLDVGFYGPLAGYVASVAAIVIGFLFSHPEPAHATAPLLQFGQPATVKMLGIAIAIVHSSTPGFGSAIRHPVLIAGWVGLFITALNLIPGGQLDGGHILYAISPQWHRRTTRVLPFLLMVCGFFFWVGWILWGAILIIPAMRHPNLPESEPPGLKRVMLAVLALAIFALTLTLSPFESSSIAHYLNFRIY